MLEHFDTVLSFSVVMLLLSLLVTTIVQMAVAISGLRASVLQWGLEKLLCQLSPKLGEISPSLKKSHAQVIATAVLHHPMIQHADKSPATSIRKDELIRLLDELAKEGSGLEENTRKALNDVMKVARSAEFDSAAEQLKTALAAQFPQAQQIIDGKLADARKVVSDLNVWFDTVMDRTTDNFLLKTRKITVVVALGLAFVFHVDSLAIIKQLASNPELRAKLVQSADATLNKAQYTLALTAERQAIASAAIASLRASLSNNADALLLVDCPTNLVSRGEGETWLNAKLTSSTNRTRLLDAYGQNYEERTKVWLGDLRQSANDLNTTLRDSDLKIISSSIPSICKYWTEPGHLWGTLMTVVFLSLGAPFWFNALRQLSNLRPTVAGKIDPKSLTGK